MGRTTIQVSDELADELHDRKSRGDSYEDVIWRLTDRSEVWNAALSMIGDSFTAADVVEQAELEMANVDDVEVILKEIAQKGWIRRNRNEDGIYEWSFEDQKLDDIRDVVCERSGSDR
ncbi:hypothetical protein [Haloarcula amylolytica]|uniref:hypothetical protein n=1 Tax=Haloarcula amylolytica TaxID=396317 RepID=UPI003C7354CA